MSDAAYAPKIAQRERFAKNVAEVACLFIDIQNYSLHEEGTLFKQLPVGPSIASERTRHVASSVGEGEKREEKNAGNLLPEMEGIARDMPRRGH